MIITRYTTSICFKVNTIACTCMYKQWENGLHDCISLLHENGQCYTVHICRSREPAEEVRNGVFLGGCVCGRIAEWCYLGGDVCRRIAGSPCGEILKAPHIQMCRLDLAEFSCPFVECLPQLC